MGVSGLVITLRSAADTPRVASALEADRRLIVGPLHGARLPVAVETASEEENQRVFDELRRLPGVAHVDVAFVEFAHGDEPIAAGAGDDGDRP